MKKLSSYRIVLSENAVSGERRAAALLAVALQTVTGVRPAVVSDAEPPVARELVIGKTARETADGLQIARSRDRLYEYRIVPVGERLYFLGLGTADEKHPVFLPDDGSLGTAFAVYRFIEEVMGWDYQRLGRAPIPFEPDLALPEGYAVEYTKEAFLAERPQKIDGAAMYLIPTATRKEWQNGCVIWKTASGKLIVLDGGFVTDTEHVLDVLEFLSDGKKPVVSAWLYSHIHGDHFGVYSTLCTDPAARARVTVEKFYCNLLDEEFYGSVGSDASANYPAVVRAFLSSGETVGAEVCRVEKGDVIIVDEFSFEVLHTPDPALRTKLNMNDTSVIYKLNYDNRQTMMLLGDGERYCSADLLANAADKLKSDVVQIGHHGCYSVSQDCYQAIGAKIAFFQISNRFWYSDGCEGLSTRNTGVFRTREYLDSYGFDWRNSYRDTNGIVSLKLPIEEIR